ncbi:HAD-IIB family hydrolase [Sphingomonas pruni]|uniref:HAD-IIB family hydrolase n=1 Tax=Sphingomonas pruni TaxID=40683 RepID=UPI00082EA3FC|nr:HAD-IIB family hydrolase [Sphingomonas pruni]
MKKLVAFDLDGTLALSKQPLDDDMAERIADLLDVCLVDIISGGDWPQFEKQVVSRLPERAKLANLFIQPTTGTKLYRWSGEWKPVYAELFSADERHQIETALDDAVKAEGLDEGQTWGDRIEDRGSQITFSGLGQEAPLIAKNNWDADRSKREALQKRLRQALPDLSINIGGSTSIDITRKGVDKQYGLTKLLPVAGVGKDEVLFVGDAIFPGGNDYPAKEMGLDTIKVDEIEQTRLVISTVATVLKD